MQLLVYTVYRFILSEIYMLPLSHWQLESKICAGSYMQLKIWTKGKKLKLSFFRYLNATEEELEASDRLCIICREEMISAKKLDCGHMFHFKCLKSWLERQQSCPTCRSHISPQPSPPSPVVMSPPIRQDQYLRTSIGSPNSSTHVAEEYHIMTDVSKKVATLRKIQGQINEIIVEFDRFKSESEK